MTLNKHFRDFIALLAKHGVEYLVVGGYAVGFHGFPRYTGDLDIFVAISERNAAGLVAAFSEFGFSDIGLKESDFLDKDTIVEIGREPLKIQVLTGIDGVGFDACYRRRVIFEDGTAAIPFISLEDLIANKDAAPRPKDKIDLDELRKIRGEKQL
jgi:hypothetical protein